MNNTLNKIHKHVTMVFCIGCIYLLFELVQRTINGSMIGFQVNHMTHSTWSLAAWTSLWMIPVGGLCGYSIGWLNEPEWAWAKKFPIILQALFGSMFFIWPMEFMSGIILNGVFELGIWDYSHKPFNLFGQITLTSLPGFTVVAIFAIWLDDFLRHWNLGEARPAPWYTYYWRAITFKK